MSRLLSLFVILSLCLAGAAWAGDVQVVNPKAGFPEGPLWHKGKLYYAEYGSHVVKTWDGKQNVEFWAMKGCGPSAVAALPNGDLVVTCYDSGQVARISAEGKTITLYDKDQAGAPFQGPNDFAADAKGGVYFSCSGPWESEPIVGKIFYLNPAGKVVEVANDLHYANGLVLSKDGSILYCAESEAGRVIQFKVAADGSLSDRRLYVRVGQVDKVSGAGAYPDGLKMDSKGNLYIGQYSSGRIVVVSPEKKFVRALTVPSPAAPNLNFSPDEAFVYVTAVDDTSNAPYWGKVYKLPNK